MNPLREQQIWWEIRDRDAHDAFEVWTHDVHRRTSINPASVHWADCERCFRERLLMAASDHLNPYIAFTHRAPRYQWSYVDHEPFVRPLTLKVRR